MIKLTLKLLCGLSFALTPATVLAQEPMKVEGKHGSITPYIWGVAVSGDAAVGPITGDVDVPFSDILDKTNFALFVEGEYWNGRWGVLGNVMYSALEDGRPGVVGAISSDIKQTMIGAAISYRFGPFGTDGNRSVIDPYFGVRYTNLDMTVDLANGAVSANRETDFWDPVIGGRVISEIGSNKRLIFAGDIGGFGVGSDFSWQAIGMISFDNKAGNGSFGVGYRALGQDISKGGAIPISVDTVYHGPVAAYTFRF